MHQIWVQSMIRSDLQLSDFKPRTYMMQGSRARMMTTMLLVLHPNHEAPLEIVQNPPDNNLGNMRPLNLSSEGIHSGIFITALNTCFKSLYYYLQCLSKVRSEVYSQFLLIILDTPAAATNQTGIYNNTPNQISVRITNDNEDGMGTTGFKDIEPGKYELWTRKHWQVAFVLRHAVEPTDGKAETLVVKPNVVYNINNVRGSARNCQLQESASAPPKTSRQLLAWFEEAHTRTMRTGYTEHYRQADHLRDSDFLLNGRHAKLSSGVALTFRPPWEAPKRMIFAQVNNRDRSDLTTRPCVDLCERWAFAKCWLCRVRFPNLSREVFHPPLVIFMLLRVELRQFRLSQEYVAKSMSNFRNKYAIVWGSSPQDNIAPGILFHRVPRHGRIRPGIARTAFHDREQGHISDTSPKALNLGDRAKRIIELCVCHILNMRSTEPRINIAPVACSVFHERLTQFSNLMIRSDLQLPDFTPRTLDMLHDAGPQRNDDDNATRFASEPRGITGLLKISCIPKENVENPPDNNLGNMRPLNLSSEGIHSGILITALNTCFKSLYYIQCLSKVRSEVYSQFLLIILDTPAASENQTGVYNNTSTRISVRVTNSNNDTGTEEFVDIESKTYYMWDRKHWQVAFVVRNSTWPCDATPEVLVVKPSDVHYVNDV
ncbi:hypothetical protein DEU56DRAFT_756285 [Suillus clintonianus]|uniref:uncharacterized protein n=1 Tax=Suillus clintonianus TaxID=1904413 RepID=UPI001B87389A|nr:uncharacterized protein DEU56DRAFT_756285 [Suillus clintonianus]KAG2136719.1 hypothetical protein DEU56DRAFT_756285 [Suillus clintonianus]